MHFGKSFNLESVVLFINKSEIMIGEWAANFAWKYHRTFSISLPHHRPGL